LLAVWKLGIRPPVSHLIDGPDWSGDVDRTGFYVPDAPFLIPVDPPPQPWSLRST
jgi:hypothetical protein